MVDSIKYYGDTRKRIFLNDSRNVLSKNVDYFYINNKKPEIATYVVNQYKTII